MAKQPQFPTLPLEMVLDEYDRDLRREQKSPKTMVSYRQVLHLLFRFLTERLERAPTLDDFTVKQCEAFFDHLLDRGKRTRHPSDAYIPLAQETLRNYTRTLKAFASWLVAPKQHYTEDNRLQYLTMPKKAETYKLPLDVTEIQALVDSCDVTTVLGSRDVALLLTLIDSGLRAMEIAHLRVADVNGESGQLFVAAGKGRKSRTVTVGDNTCRMLRRYAFFRDALHHTAPSPEDPFFQTVHGRAFTYDGLKEWMRRLGQHGGVPRVHLHLLRHTSAVQTLEVPGADLFTLQQKLGHADIATTRRYLYMTTGKLSERQRTFSPVDHIGLHGLLRKTPPEKTDGRQWHQRHSTQE